MVTVRGRKLTAAELESLLKRTTSSWTTTLLCGKCNSAIGLLAEDPERFRRAADYVA